MREAGRRALRLDSGLFTLSFYLGADTQLCDASMLSRLALLNYAVFRATNLYRPSGPARGVVACDAIEEYIKLSTRGHPASRKLVDSLWLSPVSC